MNWDSNAKRSVTADGITPNGAMTGLLYAMPLAVVFWAGIALAVRFIA